MTWHIHLPRGVDKSHTGDQKRDSYAANFLHLRMQETFAFCSELLHDGIESKVNAEDGEENKRGNFFMFLEGRKRNPIELSSVQVINL